MSAYDPKRTYVERLTLATSGKVLNSDMTIKVSCLLFREAAT